MISAETVAALQAPGMVFERNSTYRTKPDHVGSVRICVFAARAY